VRVIRNMWRHCVGRMQGILMLRHAVYLLRYHDLTDYERSDFESYRDAQMPLVLLRYLLDKIKICPKLCSCLCYGRISTKPGTAIPTQLTSCSRFLLPYSIDCAKTIYSHINGEYYRRYSSGKSIKCTWYSVVFIRNMALISWTPTLPNRVLIL